MLQQNYSKALDDTGSLYQSKASQKSPFMAAGSATQSTMGNTSNLKGKLTSLEVSQFFIKHKCSFHNVYGVPVSTYFTPAGNDSPTG